MKTKALLFTFSFAMAAFTSGAQPFQNEGFETWNPSGQPAPFDWEEPAGWSTSNAASEFAGHAVRKQPMSFSGSYSAEVRTLNLFGDPAPGILVNGTGARIDHLGGTTDVTLAGLPMDPTMTTFGGYYRYSSSSNYDSAWVEVHVKHWSSAAGKSVLVGSNTLALGPNGNFQPFSIDIAYELPIGEVIDPNQDTLVVAFYSTKPHWPRQGGVLELDDIYGGALNTPEYTREDFTVAPNPARSGHEVNLNLPVGDDETVNWTLTDLTGRIRNQGAGQARAIRKFMLPSTRPGGYILTVETSTAHYHSRLLITN